MTLPTIVRRLGRIPGFGPLMRIVMRLPFIRTLRAGSRGEKRDYLGNVSVPAAVCGRLSVSAYGDRTGGVAASKGIPRPTRHRHAWVANWHYQGMEDNDLRGFVDGRFRHAWNQPSQIHVRLGRFGKHGGGGETELFRVIQRWEDLRLPPGAKVDHVRIQVEVEHGSERDLEILLYEVHKDWKPGQGGIQRNNNSVPAAEEVWWNEVGHRVRPWGLPGAGFASDSHVDADTPTMPLARATYRPGDQAIVFESSSLTEYVGTRIVRGEPLLLLLKLSDYLEDILGSVLHLFSANHGDSRNPERRPRCIVEWHSAAEVHGLVEDVLLEHGRSLILPSIRAGGIGNVAISFERRDGCEAPTVHVRGGKGDVTSDWRPACHPLEADWTWLEVRLDAWWNPVPVGTHFEAELRDTWVLTGPPEDQEVAWTFISPSGEEQAVLAAYQGNSRWQVRFLPLEVGRWRYRWTQRFIETPYESAEGRFDVVAEDPAAVVEALGLLEERIAGSELPPGRPRMKAFGPAFLRLQRALMRFQTPDTFPMTGSETDGGEAGAVIDRVRRAITGREQRGPRLELRE